MLGELIISAIVVGCVVKALGSRSSRRPSWKDPDKRVCRKCGNTVNRSYDGKFHCRRCRRRF